MRGDPLEEVEQESGYAAIGRAAQLECSCQSHCRHALRRLPRGSCTAEMSLERNDVHLNTGRASAPAKLDFRCATEKGRRTRPTIESAHFHGGIDFDCLRRQPHIVTFRHCDTQPKSRTPQRAIWRGQRSLLASYTSLPPVSMSSAC